MKNFLKLSALAAVLVTSATYASAGTINFVSGPGSLASSTTDLNGALGFAGYSSSTSNTTIPGGLTYSGGSAGTGLGTTATSATTGIGTGIGSQLNAWSGPIGSSSWVSFADTEPGGLVPNNGAYVYETTIDTTGLGSNLTGTLDILADDTVNVFLNGVEVVTSTTDTDDSHCSNGIPSCVGTGSVYTGITGWVSGSNTLVFVVEQTGLDAEGVDFTGSVTGTSPVPEPSSLLMLGTGLLGSAGALFRRMRSK
jgi:hypothetical protein